MYRWLFAGAAVMVFSSGGALSVKAATLLSGFTEAAWGASLATGCTAMAFAPDGRLFVCQQNGSLRVISKAGTLLTTPFLTVTVSSSGERGLLGVAFDPDFASNHYVYIYYTATTPAIHNRVSRFTADTSMPANGNVVLAGSELPILDLENLSATNHNGGAIHFGPDNKLYIAVGENAVGSNSQSLTTRLGKILRINSNGTIPSDNPTSFTGVSGSTTGIYQSIWAVGLRNPFTFSFQPGSTRMFINDVGSSFPGAGGNGVYEEVNDGIAGSNYGWNVIEGPSSPPYTSPLYSYQHNNISSAIAGSAFYNPDILQFPASYIGKYFFGDYQLNFIRVMDTSNNTATNFATGAANPVDVHVGPDGALYYLGYGGQVMRVQANPSQALNISTRARVETGDNVLIGGFIVTGSVAKKVIVRAIGPSLAGFGLSGVLADPILELHEPGNVVVTNDNWQDDPSQASMISATGLAPSNSAESAIVATLQPGAYTAIVSGKNGTSGVGLAEVYDLDTAASSQLGNISGRGFVQIGDNVMIGGFIVGNNIGAARVVLRALGPSLSGSGLSSVLPDPILELHDSNGALIGLNDNWQDDPNQAALITDSGLAPTNNLESAILAGLAPGAYTAIVVGKNGGTGIGLVEVYKVGP